MATKEIYEVFALRCAERTNRTRVEVFRVADDHDAPMPIDFYLWVVRNDEKHEQYGQLYCRDREEVDRREVAKVVTEK